VKLPSQLSLETLPSGMTEKGAMMEEARDGVVSLPRESGPVEERMLEEDSRHWVSG
jgi:hypothetical protein